MVQRWLRTVRPSEFPLGLGGTIYLVQVAVGLLLFATFQEYVPNTLGSGDALPGILVTAYGGARFLFETPMGAVTDRIERKAGLLLGFVVMGIAVILMAVVQEPVAYIGFAAMLGMGNAFLWPAAYAISADLYPSSARGRTSGFLNVAQLLGFGTGALLGAVAVEYAAGMQFVVAIGAIVLAFGLVLRVVPKLRGGKLFSLAKREERPSMWSVMTLRVGAMAGLVLAASSSSAMLVPAIRPFGEEQLSTTFATLTLAMGPAVIIGASVYVPAGQIADRFGRTYPFIAGQLLVCTGLISLSLVSDLWVAAALAVLVFSGYTMSIPAWSSAVMDLAPMSHRGAVIGLTVSVSGLGLAVGPTIGGIITESLDAVATLRTAATLSLVTGLAIWGYWKAFGDGREKEAAETPAAS